MKSSLERAITLLLAMLILSTSNSFATGKPLVAMTATADNSNHESVPNKQIPPNDPIPLTILSPVGYDIAQQLGIIPVLTELYALHAKNDSVSEIKHLQLKQKLTDSVLIATLQVRDVTARIDREIARFDRLQGYLQDRRDKALRLNTIGTALGVGAVNEVGQAGEMKVNEIPGETTELVGNGITMVLSALSLYMQSGRKQTVPNKPNMLSKIFDCKTDKNTDYPAVVWNYLNRVPVDGSTAQTRRQNLFQHWRHYGLIGKGRNIRDQKRYATLTNTGRQSVESIDLIDDQKALLSDVKAEIYQLDRDLLELLLNTQLL